MEQPPCWPQPPRQRLLPRRARPLLGARPFSGDDPAGKARSTNKISLNLNDYIHPDSFSSTWKCMHALLSLLLTPIHTIYIDHPSSKMLLLIKKKVVHLENDGTHYFIYQNAIMKSNDLWD